MKHHAVGLVGWQATDGVALARVHGVTGGGQHHAQRHARVPVQRHLVQLGAGGREQHLGQVGTQPHHDRLGLRVAHAAVEFERLHTAIGRDHQAGVQETGVRNAVGRHPTQRGQDHLVHGALVHRGRHHRRRRIGAHTAGVRTLVGVQQALVVLAGGQRQRVHSVAQHDEAGLFAFEELLNHHASAAFVVRHAQLVVQQHEVDGLVRFDQRHRHHHALARCQPVGLDHDGRALGVHIGMGLRRVGEGLVLGRGNAMALHEGLAEGLGAFELRGLLRRTEDGQTMGTELVHHTGRQRRLGADHGQADAVGLRPFAQRHLVGDGQVRQLHIARGARIARCDKHLLHAFRLLELPRQRVLAATAANHQDFHSLISALWNTSCTSSRSSMTSSSFCMRAASSPVSSMVFSGRMVTSATSGLRPAASSAFFTASKSV